MEYLVTLLIGMLGGVAVGTQTPIANMLSQRLGGAAGSFVVHISGAIFSGVLLLARGGETINQIRTLPWWSFGVGLMGVILFLTITHTIPRLGASAAISLIIVGQVFTGMFIDQFGLLGVAARSIDGTRILAALCLLAGAYLLSR